LKGRYTTNAEAHLRAKHADKEPEFKEKKRIHEEKQKAEEDKREPQEKITKYSSKQEKKFYSKDQLRALAVLIASTSVPFSIVESDEFEAFCKSLKPDFAVPNKKIVMKEITAVHLDMNKVIATRLSMAGKITLCIDEWTKKGMTLSVVGFTAHFFNQKSHKLERILLGLRRIANDRTTLRIRQLTKEILEEWQIEEAQVWRVITDNAKTKTFHMVSLDGEEYQLNQRQVQLDEDNFGDSNLDESFDEDAMNDYEDGADDVLFQEAFALLFACFGSRVQVCYQFQLI